MRIEVKNILIKSLKEYNSKTLEEQEELREQVKTQLKRNRESIKRIGFTLDSDKVEAGEIFLRYANLQKHTKNQSKFKNNTRIPNR